MYFYWPGPEQVTFPNTDSFVFDGTTPRVDPCVVKNPVAFRLAACHGLWYVHVMKLGTVASTANTLPWKHYRPMPRWLVGL